MGENLKRAPTVGFGALTPRPPLPPIVVDAERALPSVLIRGYLHRPAGDCCTVQYYSTV